MFSLFAARVCVCMRVRTCAQTHVHVPVFERSPNSDLCLFRPCNYLSRIRILILTSTVYAWIAEVLFKSMQHFFHI
jgi:hypothetical protein